MKRLASYLVCYDIAHPGRLGRVHRIVASYALMVQYSVYYLYADRETVNALCGELRACIAPEEDDVRIYPLASNPECTLLGQAILPEGIQLLGTGTAPCPAAGQHQEPT